MEGVKTLGSTADLPAPTKTVLNIIKTSKVTRGDLGCLAYKSDNMNSVDYAWCPAVGEGTRCPSSLKRGWPGGYRNFWAGRALCAIGMRFHVAFCEADYFVV